MDFENDAKVDSEQDHLQHGAGFRSTLGGKDTARCWRRGNHARLHSQMPSRVLKKPGGNERQERKDVVSGRRDGNCGAGNTMGRQQNRTETRSSESEEDHSCSRLPNVTTLSTTHVEVTRTGWHGQYAIVVATEKVHAGGKNGKNCDGAAEQLGKPGDNGATPALVNLRQGIAHRGGPSVRCRSQSNRTGSGSEKP